MFQEQGLPPSQPNRTDVGTLRKIQGNGTYVVRLGDVDQPAPKFLQPRIVVPDDNVVGVVVERIARATCKGLVERQPRQGCWIVLGATIRASKPLEERVEGFSHEDC